MRVGVIGAGSWGTALAKLLAECGHTVTLWAHGPETVTEILETRENTRYLPGFKLPNAIIPTNDLQRAAEKQELIVSVSPSHVVREVMSQVGPYIGIKVPVVSATKGIENGTLMMVSEILEDVLPLQCHPFLAYLSGPSFAREVAACIPTAMIVASYSDKLGKSLQTVFHAPYMRVYSSIDVVGVEMGGALKNVIAIAAGVCVGMGLGHNSRAGMITRGLNEIARLAVRRGANPITLMGLAGMGDLVLTCTGPLSRNRTVGEMLGKGMTINEVLANMTQVAEGVKTAKSVHDLSRKLDVEMPISEQVYLVIHEGKPVDQALADLMGRDLKRETVF